MIPAEAASLERNGGGLVDDGSWVGLGGGVELRVRERGKEYFPVGTTCVDVNASGDGGGDDDVVGGADGGEGDELVIHVVELEGVSM